jgi:predicted  nucleic acid-binding Zn-ribbon protein
MNDDELTAEDQRFIRLFNKGFEEVVVPRLEDIEEKVESLDKKVGGMNARFSEMEQRFEDLETKMDAGFNRLEGKFDRLADKSQDHEQRISAIEKVPAVAHDLKH